MNVLILSQFLVDFVVFSFYVSANFTSGRLQVINRDFG